MTNQEPEILWKPDTRTIEESNLSTYLNWLEENRDLSFQDYDALWKWSVNNVPAFWESLVDYFEIQFHTPPQNTLSDDPMPRVRWFEGATLNYTEHIFRNKNAENPAIIYLDERHTTTETSWTELEKQVASLAHWLVKAGVKKGDRVAAYLPNIPEATAAMLATAAVGAIWTSTSPDFGADSVIDRFQQTEPKVLIAAARYSYNGKEFDRSEVIEHLKKNLPTVESLIMIDDSSAEKDSVNWSDIMRKNAGQNIPYTYVDFMHPIWILYSSGTTGKPKAITHSQGGILLEHLKYLHFHNDLKPGERYFWFSTTGWMMWNFVQGVLLLGGTIVLYNGSPSYPDLGVLWRLIDSAKIAHFGTSAPFILACKKAGISPKSLAGLNSLRSLSSTGAPLPSEGFQWLKEEVKDPLWTISMSGGTDLCTAFVGGVPAVPVYLGEIQRACLGASVDAFNERGEPLRNEEGEMVLTKPMPSMPVFFWGDESFEKYTESYFEMFPNIWRHGDWLTITDRKTLIISGRSDATLNRNGIRIGTAEIYRVIDQISQVEESLIVNIEKKNGEHFMPLFVKMRKGQEFNQNVEEQINTGLRKAYSPRHVPDTIIAVNDIPFTLSGKKMEAPVKKILMGIPPEKAVNLGSMRNPESVTEFVTLGEGRLKEILKSN
ncbi:acetoacetate--CoA ligase [Jiulongibacter sediminis]|uniref:Acetoacetyl-CoA synthetase n=1 Tax=Jiulongibacter sediminis TaxID=1605367 RepID=A0A0P7C0G6_9BACT|nr:acetoacetate--CoA ligase [Jiulongibacter sediminis]KPM46763.1 acetoacetyl-CoA synthetase [Jiulongibacter sediminis]TBX21667.1 acetoacetyl-CoA synthetase [Jiulongibacter sediminis]